MAILDISNITKQYGDYYAVNDVSFSVASGNIYGILGPNGAGKTTTIRMIMNILAPDSGSINLFNQSMTNELKSKIGYLPEERGLYKKMKCVDQLLFLAELHNVPSKTAKTRAIEWLEKLNLTDQIDSPVEELSKGMQQKLQLIGTFIHDPELIILDEPFSGLDPVNVNLVKNIILELKDKGKAIMLSTHMMDTAEKLCDDVLMINKGKKVLDGPLSNILIEYGKNSVHIEFSGDGSFISSLEMVQKVDLFPNYAEVELTPDTKSTDFIKELITKLDIITFKTSKSSLNEIFISLAGEPVNE